MTRRHPSPERENFSVDALPSERHRGRGVVLRSASCCAGCCCCCCCLHVLGGLLGAAIGSSPPRTRTRVRARERRTEQTVVPLYWGTFLVLAAVAAFLAQLEVESGALLVLFIFLPGVQIVASIVAAVLIQFRPEAERASLYGSLGRITLGTVIGTAGGLVIVVPILLSIFS